MEFRILGPLTVTGADGRTVAVGGPKPRTMLAALLLAGGRMLTDDQLLASLWGRHPPATVSAQLHTYASRLRKALAPDVRLVRQKPGYLLQTGPSRLDADDFERWTRLGRHELKAGRPAQAAGHLRAALALWQGPALVDVAGFLQDAELPRLEEMRLAALEDRIEAEIALGECVNVVPELTDLVARYPLRERLRAQLMTALCRCDRQADALGVFRTGRRILDDELGVGPGPALRDAYRCVISTGQPDPSG